MAVMLRLKRNSSSVMVSSKYGQLEVLGHLVAVQHRPGGEPDVGLAAQGLALAGDGPGDPGEVALGGAQQVLAFARPLAGKLRIAADDQALAGIVRRGDRRHVALVDERQLQLSALDEAADGRG